METLSKKKLDMHKLLAPAALVILYVVFSIFGNNFLSLDMVKNILESSYYIGFMAFGVTFIIITGGIDLSLGTVMMCSALLGGYAFKQGWPLILAIALTLFVGIAFGCLLANILGGCTIFDIVFGSLATLLAACVTAKLPAKCKWLAPLPPVISNALIIGALLGWYGAGFGPAFPATFAFNAATVGLGELIACYVFGGILLAALPKIKFFRSMLPADKL